MLKIKQENLIKQDNRYYYDNELFNGVIFFIKDFIIEVKKVCKDGVLSKGINGLLPKKMNNF